MIYVLAQNKRQAEYWVDKHSDPPLNRRDWTFVADPAMLYGISDITVVAYGEWWRRPDIEEIELILTPLERLGRIKKVMARNNR